MKRDSQLPIGCSNLGDNILLLSKSGERIGVVTLYEALRIAGEQHGELYQLAGHSRLPEFSIVESIKIPRASSRVLSGN